MNINRNVLKIVAGVLLVASLPAGAQVLGGGIGGAANGALGGGLGQGVHGSGGIMGGGSITGPDAVGAAGKARDRAQQAGQRTRDAATNSAGAVRSRVEDTRGAVSTTGEATATAGAAAGRGATSGATQAGGKAANEATTPASQGGLVFDGAASGGVQKQVFGRDVNANGSTASSGNADRNGINASTGGQGDVSVKKPAAAQAEPIPAQ